MYGMAPQWDVWGWFEGFNNEGKVDSLCKDGSVRKESRDPAQQRPKSNQQLVTTQNALVLSDLLSGRTHSIVAVRGSGRQRVRQTFAVVGCFRALLVRLDDANHVLTCIRALKPMQVTALFDGCTHWICSYGEKARVIGRHYLNRA